MFFCQINCKVRIEYFQMLHKLLGTSLPLKCFYFLPQEMAEYYSTVIFLSASFVLLLSSNQHLYSYLSISTEDFIQLLYVYLFLFLFELSTDICTRLFVYVVLNIDISGEATFRTVGNKETRALLAHFNLYIILSVYLSLTAIE